MSIYIGSDHGGFELKTYLLEKLKDKGIIIEDVGPYRKEMTDDYPDYAAPLSKKVAEQPFNRGILICRNGVGESIAANKINGIRAGLSWNVQHTISARKDDDINILAMPADYIDTETALHMVEAFLNTTTSTEERHLRRRIKLKQLEND